MRAGAGISSAPDPREAAETAAEAALEGLGGGEAVGSGSRTSAALLFATEAHADRLDTLLEAAIGALGTTAVVGATSHGVLGRGREVEEGAGVSILALGDVEARPFLLHDLAGGETEAVEEIAVHLDHDPRPEDLVLLLPDPASLRPQVLFDGLRASLGEATVVGAGASDPVGSRPLQWCGHESAAGGLAGLALRLERRPRIGVTQGCRPATELLTVTRTQGNWILELDGRPALDVYREAARGPLADDLRRAASFILVALPRDEAAPLEPGGYLVRHAVGFAEDQRAFAIPEKLSSGDRVALVVREPEAAREDLKSLLQQIRRDVGPDVGRGPDRSAAGLYFDCCARGTGFFGVPGLEAAYLEQAFGEVPIAGMFGSCEIGPIAGETQLLTYTGVLALFDG